MSFRVASSPKSSGGTGASSLSSRPIKSPKHIRVISRCPQQQFSVPSGQNWVYASGGSRTVRFDFNKALEEQIASEDETCGSSQEYYARKYASSISNNRSSNLPASTYKPDPRYPTQRPNYTFNFDRATDIDVENMNTALPFGPMPSPERKHKAQKDLGKFTPAQPSLPKQSPFEFGRKITTFSAPPSVLPARAAITPAQTNSTTLTTRSQNHDENFRRTCTKTRIVTTNRK